MKILVTGAAGFIGFHVSQALLARGDIVVGIDNLNDYYDVSLKQSRLDQLTPYDNFTFIKMDIADQTAMESLSNTHQFDKVVHLAAQAGVRYSLENPRAYIQSNVMGHLNILELCRTQSDTITRLVYASSSSVYGGNDKKPFSVTDNVDCPVSLYAATKKSDELMSHTYAHLYGVDAIGLRFFTVYGPWGRPDMAYFSFTNDMMAGKAIKVFNNGEMKRDFTYIDDIIDGVLGTLDMDAQTKGNVPHAVYNLGNNKTETLMDFITTLEQSLGISAIKDMYPMQPGDVKETYADVTQSTQDFGYNPKTTIKDGLNQFVSWYRDYYQIPATPSERQNHA